jgi:phage RecT family recombinase
MEHSVANELVAFENMLQPLAPRFEQALGNVMPVDRLMRTIMISVERTPKLLQADRQSLINSAMSAACLGLEVDGVTGQAYFVPFAGKAQLIVGYKGYNTLGARAGLTIQGEVVRKGDAFDYELGDKSFVRHKPLLGNQGPIIAAWASASALSRPSIVSILSIDEIMAVMEKSPGAKMSDSPWRDKNIGFPAMASKTAKRRLSRSTPLNVMQMAAALDGAFEERGRHAWIDPQHGLQIEGEAEGQPRIIHEQRGAAELIAPPKAAVPTANEYLQEWDGIIRASTDAAALHERWRNDGPLRRKIAWKSDDDWRGLQARVSTAIENLKAPA